MNNNVISSAAPIKSAVMVDSDSIEIKVEDWTFVIPIVWITNDAWSTGIDVRKVCEHPHHYQYNYGSRTLSWLSWRVLDDKEYEMVDRYITNTIDHNGCITLHDGTVLHKSRLFHLNTWWLRNSLVPGGYQRIATEEVEWMIIDSINEADKEFIRHKQKKEDALLKLDQNLLKTAIKLGIAAAEKGRAITNYLEVVDDYEKAADTYNKAADAYYRMKEKRR